jgi:hypothetical protein
MTKYTLVPAAITHDSENNFNTIAQCSKPICNSNRANTGQWNSSWGIAGYKQIGDTIFSTMCGTIENW